MDYNLQIKVENLYFISRRGETSTYGFVSVKLTQTTDKEKDVLSKSVVKFLFE